MAAKAVQGIICLQRGCIQAYQLQITTLNCSPLLCHQQIRWRKGVETKKNIPKPWHVKRRAPFLIDHLTAENRESLKEVIEMQYADMEPSVFKNEPVPRNEYIPGKTRRTGVLGMKIGVSPQWKKDGTKILCTLIQVLDNHVIRYTPPEVYRNSPGFIPGMYPDAGSVVVGALGTDPRKFTKAYANLFLEAGVPPKRKLTRFLVTPDAAVAPGTPLSVLHFKVGDYVDCSAKSINHGFQGVMKRFGFSGGRASHGVTKSHRRAGATSGGRPNHGLWKGSKMPGHMGNVWRKNPGLKIWRINTKYNILYVGHAVPGPTHGFVRVYDSVCEKNAKRVMERGGSNLMPTYYPGDIEGKIPEDLYDEELFQFTDPSIQFETSNDS